tara:strand:- start:373 stop:528 length:156 start_codon:yes stop_codon:yes gene_type:complete
LANTPGTENQGTEEVAELNANVFKKHRQFLFGIGDIHFVVIKIALFFTVFD